MLSVFAEDDPEEVAEPATAGPATKEPATNEAEVAEGADIVFTNFKLLKSYCIFIGNLNTRKKSSMSLKENGIERYHNHRN